jgi:putative lipoic acid-binding regulatory protein
MQEADYPQEWSYRLICTDEKSAFEAAENVLADRPYDLKPRNSSRNGTFVSLDLKCSVLTDEDKKNLNTMLSKQPGIKMIL